MSDTVDHGGLAAGQFIVPQCHEFRAQYNFDAGLDAIFAADSRIKDGGGSVSGQFSAFDDVWSVSLSYTSGNGLIPPEGDHTPQGTEWHIDNIREYELRVDAVEDDTAGQKSFYSRLSPRWHGMRTQDNNGNVRAMSVPFDEGFNLNVQGSNIHFLHYQRLIKQAFLAVGINGSYFSSSARHESSTLSQAELYVRVHNDCSGPIHARDGPLARIGHLLEHDRGGRRRIEQADVTETGEVCPGYRHQAGIDEKRVQEVWPRHQLPKQFKHYQVRHATSVTGSLSHPKLGSIYYPKLWRNQLEGSFGVSTEDLTQLYQELESSLLSILHDAGLDVTSAQQYVADDYFSAETSNREVNVVNLPLEEIAHDQESVVIKHLADGLSPIQQQTIETLVSDGGQVAPSDIAEDGGFHPDSVYRALDQMDDLIEREYGSVSVSSTHIADLIHTSVQQAKQRTREAVRAGSRALEAAERGLDEQTQAWFAWASKYLDGYQELSAYDGVKVNIGTLDQTFESPTEARRHIRRILRDGFQKWQAMGKDESEWRQGRVEAECQIQKNSWLRSLHDQPPTEKRHYIDKIWRLLDSDQPVRPTR
jgi:hypothetical protein